MAIALASSALAAAPIDPDRADGRDPGYEHPKEEDPMHPANFPVLGARRQRSEDEPYSTDRTFDWASAAPHSNFTTSVVDGALTNLGDGGPLYGFWEKVRAGLPTRTVLLGGSVECANDLNDFGSALSRRQRFSYGAKFVAWLNRAFPVEADPRERHELVNLCTAAAGTKFTVGLVDEWIATHGLDDPGGADLIVASFGVNDDSYVFSRSEGLPDDVHTERLIRRLRALNSRPALIYYEFHYYLTNPEGGADEHIAVLRHYGVPALDFRKALLAGAEPGAPPAARALLAWAGAPRSAGGLWPRGGWPCRWNDVSGRCHHPTARGHRALAEFLALGIARRAALFEAASPPRAARIRRAVGRRARAAARLCGRTLNAGGARSTFKTLNSKFGHPRGASCSADPEAPLAPRAPLPLGLADHHAPKGGGGSSSGRAPLFPSAVAWDALRPVLHLDFAWENAMADARVAKHVTSTGGTGDPSAALGAAAPAGSTGNASAGNASAGNASAGNASAGSPAGALRGWTVWDDSRPRKNKYGLIATQPGSVVEMTLHVRWGAVVLGFLSTYEQAGRVRVDFFDAQGAVTSHVVDALDVSRRASQFRERIFAGDDLPGREGACWAARAAGTRGGAAPECRKPWTPLRARIELLPSDGRQEREAGGSSPNKFKLMSVLCY
jgi:hypothetical protein